MSHGENTRLILSSLASGAIGYVLHVLKARGEDRARKHADENAQKDRIREFRGFMSAFHSWAQRSILENLGKEFSARVHLLRERSVMVKDDLPENSWPQFDEAVEVICRMTANNVTECETDYSGTGPRRKAVGRTRLLSAIDSLTKIVE